METDGACGRGRVPERQRLGWRVKGLLVNSICSKARAVGSCGKCPVTGSIHLNEIRIICQRYYRRYSIYFSPVGKKFELERCCQQLLTLWVPHSTNRG